ncbi:MAG: putative metal-binding motif-containing protein [Myxococcota bacterium]
MFILVCSGCSLLAPVVSVEDSSSGATDMDAGADASLNDPADQPKDGLPGCTPSAEICDGVDNDCDDAIDEDCVDADSDGVCAAGVDVDLENGAGPDVCPLGGADCDDESADVFPGARELCDATDHDCDENPGAPTFGSPVVLSRPLSGGSNVRIIEGADGEFGVAWLERAALAPELRFTVISRDGSLLLDPVLLSQPTGAVGTLDMAWDGASGQFAVIWKQADAQRRHTSLFFALVNKEGHITDGPLFVDTTSPITSVSITLRRGIAAVLYNKDLGRTPELYHRAYDLSVRMWTTPVRIRSDLRLTPYVVRWVPEPSLSDDKGSLVVPSLSTTSYSLLTFPAARPFADVQPTEHHLPTRYHFSRGMTLVTTGKSSPTPLYYASMIQPVSGAQGPQIELVPLEPDGSWPTKPKPIVLVPEDAGLRLGNFLVRHDPIADEFLAAAELEPDQPQRMVLTRLPTGQPGSSRISRTLIMSKLRLLSNGSDQLFPLSSLSSRDVVIVDRSSQTNGYFAWLLADEGATALTEKIPLGPDASVRGELTPRAFLDAPGEDLIWMYGSDQRDASVIAKFDETGALRDTMSVPDSDDFAQCTPVPDGLELVCARSNTTSCELSYEEARLDLTHPAPEWSQVHTVQVRPNDCEVEALLTSPMIRTGTGFVGLVSGRTSAGTAYVDYVSIPDSGDSSTLRVSTRQALVDYRDHRVSRGEAYDLVTYSTERFTNDRIEGVATLIERERAEFVQSVTTFNTEKPASLERSIYEHIGDTFWGAVATKPAGQGGGEQIVMFALHAQRGGAAQTLLERSDTREELSLLDANWDGVHWRVLTSSVDPFTDEHIVQLFLATFREDGSLSLKPPLELTRGDGDEFPGNFEIQGVAGYHVLSYSDAFGLYVKLFDDQGVPLERGTYAFSFNQFGSFQANLEFFDNALHWFVWDNTSRRLVQVPGGCAAPED